jgi:homoserine O-acetyltransferase
MIGPGKPIDTNRFFVVSSNVLGSSYGSSAPADTDPATGKPYGPGFPAVTLHDMVDAQKRLLDKLGVKHLVAVAGGSYGGYQGFAWATRYPRMMDGVVVTVSAPNTTADAASVERLRADLARDPNWNGGQYYDKGGILPTMIDMRVATLKRCGIEAPLMAEFPDKDAREAEIRRRAEPWARAFDGNSLIVLRRASVGFDTRPMFKDIKAKVLYVLSSTDRVFPPEIAPRTMDALKAAGVDATYVLVDSIHGHSGATVDADKWLPDLKAFMDRVAPPPNAKPR